jgi:dipeptidase E
MFALIGGKANKEKITNKIEQELVKLTNKEKPVILYCPYASKDIEKSNLKFKLLIDGINADIIYLSLENISQFEELLIKSDILYIGGGVSDDLVSIFRKYGLDEILKKHIDDNIIFAGSSAGAMLYTIASMGDKYMFSDNFHNYNYKMVDCLGLLNITICPHYQNEDLIFYNDVLKEYNIDAFGIEEDTCVVIDKNRFFVIKEEGKASCYYFSKDNNYIMTPLYEGVKYEKNSGFRA